MPTENLVPAAKTTVLHAWEAGEFPLRRLPAQVGGWPRMRRHWLPCCLLRVTDAREFAAAI